MVIPIPDLKTDYEATKTTNNAYPQQWDGDNAKVIQGFEAVNAALDNVLAAQGIQFIADYTRLKDVADTPTWRVGGDCLNFASGQINSAGAFTLEANNVAGVNVAYIGNKRMQHVGAFAGDLNDLVTAGEITDQGGGAWSGTVFIGVKQFGDLDLALAFSTSFGNVECPIHEIEVSVTGLGGTPSFSADKYMLYGDGRETLWAGTERHAMLERPVTFERSFDVADTAREAIIYVPFEHTIISAYFFVEEDGVNYSGTFQIQRTNPAPNYDLFATALVFAGGITVEGPASFVGAPPQALVQREVQQLSSFYRIHFPSLPAAPTRWRVGISVRHVIGGQTS